MSSKPLGEFSYCLKILQLCFIIVQYMTRKLNFFQGNSVVVPRRQTLVQYNADLLHVRCGSSVRVSTLPCGFGLKLAETEGELCAQQC